MRKAAASPTKGTSGGGERVKLFMIASECRDDTVAIGGVFARLVTVRLVNTIVCVKD